MLAASRRQLTVALAFPSVSPLWDPLRPGGASKPWQAVIDYGVGQDVFLMVVPCALPGTAGDLPAGQEGPPAELSIARISGKAPPGVVARFSIVC